MFAEILARKDTGTGLRERLWRQVLRRIEEPDPVSWAGSSILRGLFHPYAMKVAGLRCAPVAGILNVDEMIWGVAAGHFGSGEMHWLTRWGGGN
jgi:hypothetical protein